MKKVLLTAFLAGWMFLSAQVSGQAMGLFYTDATYPVTATGTKVELEKLKKGSVSTGNFMFLFEAGDASIEAAAKKAGISKISFIDVNEKTIFIFWRKVTVNVYGE